LRHVTSDARGPELERRLRNMAPGRRLRIAIAVDRLLAWAGDRRPRVLDAGCETGLFALELARRRPDWPIDAVDIDAGMLATGRGWAADEGLGNIAFLTRDLTVPSAERYDAVVSLETLAEIPDTEAALDGLAAAVGPAGRLMLHVPSADWMPVFAGSRTQWHREVHHGFEASALRAALEHRGLTVGELRPTTYAPVAAAQELRDRIKHRRAEVRLAVFPAMAAAVGLERRGLALGAPRALYLEADRARGLTT
jgi:2-polyprenyl-3-methyl-5-hydroxy-6-metoxy-1,4-benzoquinol methylase